MGFVLPLHQGYVREGFWEPCFPPPNQPADDPVVLSESSVCSAEDYLRRWTAHFGWASPKVFFINLFRTDASGRPLWPGYGDNIRLLQWISHRIHGGQNAVHKPA